MAPYSRVALKARFCNPVHSRAMYSHSPLLNTPARSRDVHARSAPCDIHSLRQRTSSGGRAPHSYPG
eukprot:3217377-Prymnesium_polylepis.1